MATPFTDKALAALQPTGERFQIVDPKTPGLYLRIGAGGAKSWYLATRVGGEKPREKLGDFEGGTRPMTVAQAREQFRMRVAALGAIGDLAKAKATKCKMTLDEGFTLFEQANPGSITLKTMGNLRCSYDKHVSPSIGRMQMSAIDDTHVGAVRKLMADAHASGRTINLMLTSIRSAYRHAMAQRLLPRDFVLPTVGVKGGKKGKGRRRILHQAEFQPFWDSIDRLANVKHPTLTSGYYRTVADALRMTLFTGARSANVKTMRWRDISLARRVWTVPRNWKCDYCSQLKGSDIYHGTKTDEVYEIPLASQAVEILKRRHAGPAGETDFVFPGRGDAAHLGELKHVWRTICDEAGLDGLTIHDLRRTQGSIQAQQGVNTFLVGAALCHSDPNVTAIYTHASGLDETRGNMERANRAMLNTATDEAVELTLAEWEEIVDALAAAGSPLTEKVRAVADAMRLA